MFVILPLVLASTSSLAAAERLSVESSSQATRWTVLYDGKEVMVYEFDPHKFKPYVRALNTVDGYGVLRDAPFDHLHHHALMYGIKVNGVNFWEETSGSGVQRVVATSAPVIGKSLAGLPQAVLSQELVWVPAVDAFLPLTNCSPLLAETRTLVLAIDEPRKEVALLWHSNFRVGTRTNTVVLTGANYHGLGMRFERALDPVAVHLSPGGPIDLSNARQDTSVFPWEAVAFNRPGKPATIAILGAPANLRGAPRFFSMATRFAYLSATQSLDSEPLVYKAGQSFDLRYLVVLYPQVQTVETLATRFQKFESSGQ